MESVLDGQVDEGFVDVGNNDYEAGSFGLEAPFEEAEHEIRIEFTEGSDCYAWSGVCGREHSLFGL
jgi:hypothetical protein